ncbi:hypothetical protein ACHQM5_004606 [Ranunculus cassubicifolius]
MIACASATHIELHQNNIFKYLINRCLMRKNEEESVIHLFLECPAVLRKICEPFLFAIEGSIDWEAGRGNILSLKGKINLSEVGQLYYEMIFHAVTWGIWLERNNRHFEGVERTTAQVINDIKKLLWTWGLQDRRGRSIREDQFMFHWHNIIIE